MSQQHQSTSDKLAQRKLELVARCRQQRESLHLQTQRWKQQLSWQDAVHNGLEYAKRYQLWIVGAAIGVVILKPRRVKALMQTGTTAFAAYQSMQPVIDKVQRYLWQAKHQGRMQM